MSCEKCLICSTPLKIKGTIMSSLLVLTAVATSVLSFTTNCSHVVQVSGNSTQIVNDIGTANRAVSISLVLFSACSAMFERYINKKLIETNDENEELKSQLAISRQNDSGTQREWYNEPIQTQVDTQRSEITSYPPVVSFQHYVNNRQ